MHTQNAIAPTTARRTVTSLTLFQENRLRFELRKLAPSEPWVDVQFVEVPQIDPRGRLVVRRIHDPSPFPPGGAETGMIRCRECGAFTPPHAMEAGICLDHREDGDWGKSPSAEGFRKIRYYAHNKPDQLVMKPESDAAMERLILKYQRKVKRRKSREEKERTKEQ